MCDCLEKTRKLIIEQTGSNYADIDCSTITHYKKTNPQQYKTGQRLTINYNHTKRNGEVITKNRNSFITHDYCPFCGIKY